MSNRPAFIFVNKPIFILAMMLLILPFGNAFAAMTQQQFNQKVEQYVSNGNTGSLQGLLTNNIKLIAGMPKGSFSQPVMLSALNNIAKNGGGETMLNTITGKLSNAQVNNLVVSLNQPNSTSNHLDSAHSVKLLSRILPNLSQKAIQNLTPGSFSQNVMVSALNTIAKYSGGETMLNTITGKLSNAQVNNLVVNLNQPNSTSNHLDSADSANLLSGILPNLSQNALKNLSPGSFSQSVMVSAMNKIGSFSGGNTMLKSITSRINKVQLNNLLHGAQKAGDSSLTNFINHALNGNTSDDAPGLIQPIPKTTATDGTSGLKMNIDGSSSNKNQQGEYGLTAPE